MRLEPTDIAGCMTIEIEAKADARGSFTRLFDLATVQRAVPGLVIRQVNRSWNPTRFTLRGMHLQLPPAGETKIIWCSRGQVQDVIIDLRPSSPTYCQWREYMLAAESPRLLLAPPGCAHGFLTLSDDVEMIYLISADYSPSHARTVRWSDPAFGIAWRGTPVVMSDADAHAPDYDPLRPIWPPQEA